MHTPPELETPAGQSEFETPVPQAEIETPGTEIQGASLTSHLRLAPDSLRRAEEAEESDASLRAEISNDLLGLNPPATLAESLALLTQIQREAPTDKRLVAIKKARLSWLAKHIHSQSQGNPPPSINHKAFWKRTPPASALARVAELYSRPKAKKS